MDVATLQSTLDEHRRRLREAARTCGSSRSSDEAVTLSLPVAPGLVHAGGVLCGQAIMSAADTAMLVAMIARIGTFRPMTTVQLQTSFVRPVPKETASVTVVARVLRLGKTLSYGDVEFLAAGREARGARAPRRTRC